MLKRILMGAVVALVAVGLQAADWDKLPDPVENMKVGQWVHYRVLKMGEQKQRVTAVEGEGDDRVFTLKIDSIRDGEVVGTNEKKIGVKQIREREAQARENNPDATIVEETISAGGKTFHALLVDTVNKDGTRFKVHMAKEIPITGVIKVERDGNVVALELIDFGEE